VKKISKIIISSLLLLCAIWVATPKVYIHNLLNHEHTSVSNSIESTVQAEAKDDCDFDKYDSPVYFTIFKFINSFIPTKAKEQSLLIKDPSYNTTFSYGPTSLRAPPRA
jgi:hypothetical protein